MVKFKCKFCGKEIEPKEKVVLPTAEACHKDCLWDFVKGGKEK